MEDYHASLASPTNHVPSDRLAKTAVCPECGAKAALSGGSFIWATLNTMAKFAKA